MHRLFVALRPPPLVRRRLIDAMGGVSGARWQSEEQLHLTLRFIGVVTPRSADDIAAALGRVTQPRARIAIAGTGAFDRDGVVHTLWAGVAADASLKLLHDRIARALGEAGVAPERRAFRPHVTLARLGRAAGAVEPFLADTVGLSIPQVTIGSFLLYESVLGRDGATYMPVAHYPLR